MSENKLEMKPRTTNATLHPAVPKAPKGQTWATEQVNALNGYAVWLEQWVKGEADVGPRVVLPSIAGSGKTTIIKAAIKITENINRNLKTIATAFNRSIAGILRDHLIAARKGGFHGATPIGSGSNTVNGLGYLILREQAQRMGVSVEMEPKGQSKYRSLSRIAFAEWLNDLPEEDTKALFNKVVRIQADSGIKTNHRKTWFAISNSVETGASILMDEGFDPVDFKKDKEAMQKVFKDVGAVRGVQDLLGWELGAPAFLSMIHRVMLLGKTRAFDTKSIWPVGSDGKMARNFLMPRPIDHPRSKFFSEAGKFDTGLYAFWKIAGEDRFKAFNDLQALWPLNNTKRAPAASQTPKIDGIPDDVHQVQGVLITAGSKGRWIVDFKGPGWRSNDGGKAANKKVDGKSLWMWVRDLNGHNRRQGGGHDVPADQRILDMMTKQFGSDRVYNLTGEGSLESVETDEAAPTNGTCVLGFSDQIWLPVVMDLRLENAMDVAFIDEVQDLSFAKADLVRRAVSENGAFIIVGDKRQSLYGFAGARADSMDENAKALGCKEFPLTTCYRGAHNVAASARQAMARAVSHVQGTRPTLEVPDYQCHNSPEFIETWEHGPKEMVIDFTQITETVKEIRSLDSGHDGMAIISRIAAPLGPVVKDLLREGIPVSTPTINSFDKDILKMLKAPLPRDFDKPTKPSPGFGITERDSYYPANIRSYARKIRDYLLLQATQRAGGDVTQARKDQRYNDECDMLSFTMSLLDIFWEQNGSDSKLSLAEFKKWMKEVLFSKDANAVHVATVHRYKGEEADRVFIIRSMPAQNDDGEEYARDCFLLKFAIESHAVNAVQELNCLYVAATRAKWQNIWVRGATLEDEDSEDLSEYIRDCENGDTESEPLEAPQSHANGSDGVSEPESKEGAQNGPKSLFEATISNQCGNCHNLPNPDFNDGQGYVMTAIGPRGFCSERCWAEFHAMDIEPEGHYGFLKGVGA